MDYKIVFEVTQKGLDIWWQLILPVLVGLCVSFYNIKFNKSKSPKRKFTIAFGFVFAGFGLLLSLYTIPRQISQYSEWNQRYETGNFKTVEGTINDFNPMPKGGRSRESFVVDGQYFEYSDYEVHHGFNNTASHGGPIRYNGQRVRLGYVTIDERNIILKIEMAN